MKEIIVHQNKMMDVHLYITCHVVTHCPWRAYQISFRGIPLSLRGIAFLIMRYSLRYKLDDDSSSVMESGHMIYNTYYAEDPTA